LKKIKKFFKISKELKMPEYSQGIYDKMIKMLGLPKGSERLYWDIDDHVEGTEIYLLHYKSDKIKEIIHRPGFSPVYDMEDSQLILNLRGVIVDLEERWVCCKSFGFTSVATLNEISDEEIVLNDQFNNVISAPSENVTFQTFYGGPVIRVWKYKGQVHFSSHHKISISRSKWGSSRTFEELFIDFFGRGVSSLEEIGDILFDPTKATANFCHAFLISSPEIITGIRMNIGDGYLVYLRSFVLNIFISRDAFLHYRYHKEIEELPEVNKWIQEETFVKHSTINEHGVPTPPVTNNLDTDERILISPVVFNSFIANKILKFGYSNFSEDRIDGMDVRLRPGESLIAIFPGGTYTKIVPTCANWRNYILGNNPNLYNQFCRNMDYSQNLDFDETESIPDFSVSGFEEANYNYSQLFPDLGNPTGIELENIAGKFADDELNMIPRIVRHKGGSKKQKKFEIKEDRRRNIAYCMLFAVPHYKILDLGEFYSRFTSDMDDLKAFFRDNLKKLGVAVEEKTLIEDPRFATKDGSKLVPAGKYVTRIMTEAAKYVEVRKKEGTNFTYDKESHRKVKMTSKELILDNIMGMLNKEKGANLYSLFKAISKEV
jgi:hypothetical protein